MEGESWVGVGLLGYEMKAKTRKASDFGTSLLFVVSFSDFESLMREERK